MDYIKDLLLRYPALSPCEEAIRQAAGILIATFEGGGKLLIAGNGGSAADSDHISGELLKSFLKKRRIDSAFVSALSAVDREAAAYLESRLQGALPAIALSNNSALITASLNDVDGAVIFAQQVMGLGNKGDTFLGISTSGNAKDVVFGAVTAKAKGLSVIALTGKGGGRLAPLSDCSVRVPEEETFKIQELHLPVYHVLCLTVEAYFFKE